MRHTVPNDPASASLVRGRLRRWLAGMRWPRDDADDLVIAVSEAVSNSVEHAYPDPREAGVIVIEATEETFPRRLRRIVVTVRDHGRWRPVPEDPGYRGRGLAMMRAVTDWVDIENGTAGTTVRLFGHPVRVLDTNGVNPSPV
jgi:anti-sigma regulatory factor (Ser/Thr protein kinase)